MRSIEHFQEQIATIFQEAMSIPSFTNTETEREIEEYISCGESMDKAGAYGVQGVFAAFIEGVNGSYTSVVGLPAGRTYRKLRELAEGIE